ncbi:hypothetical protein SNEBB_001791 [Seison nebaliae]|nr:hypothetical protein SNEBB_001791 [Seison nebaliae]
MAFSFIAILYLILLLASLFFIFWMVYVLIAFDELKTDFKSPVHHCNTLNPIIPFEYGGHLILTIILLFSGEFLSFFINLPLALIHIKRYRDRPVMRGWGIYDPSQIFEPALQATEQKTHWIKLVFYLFSFFYYLYCFIVSLLA